MKGTKGQLGIKLKIDGEDEEVQTDHKEGQQMRCTVGEMIIGKQREGLFFFIQKSIRDKFLL